jgi:DNA-binding FrmR family transcriptional regulator
MDPTCTRLVHHINRIEGQLKSIKKELEHTEPDCIKASQTLYSLSRSFAGLRQQFIETFLQKYMTPKKGTDGHTDAINELMKLIKS